MKKYVRICEKCEGIWRNMKKYEGICGKYEGICQKYEGIWRNMSMYWIWLFHFYMGLGTPSYSLWKLEKFRILPLYMGQGLGKIPRPSFLLSSGTWKNFDLHPYIYIYGDRLWDLEKFWVLPLYRLWDLKKCWASPSFDYSLLARCHFFVSSI